MNFRHFWAYISIILGCFLIGNTYGHSATKLRALGIALLACNYHSSIGPKLKEHTDQYAIDAAAARDGYFGTSTFNLERAKKGYKILEDIQSDIPTEPATAENIGAIHTYMYALALQQQQHCIEEMSFQVIHHEKLLTYFNSCPKKYRRLSSHFPEWSRKVHFGVDIPEKDMHKGKSHLTFTELRPKSIKSSDKKLSDEALKEILHNRETSLFIKPEWRGVNKLTDTTLHTGSYLLSIIRKNEYLRNCWNWNIDGLSRVNKNIKGLRLHPDDHITYRTEQVPQCLLSMFSDIVGRAEEQPLRKTKIRYAKTYGICYMVAKMEEYLKTKTDDPIVQNDCTLLLDHIRQQYGPQYLNIRKGNEIIWDFRQPLTQIGREIVHAQPAQPQQKHKTTDTGFPHEMGPWSQG